MRCPLTPARSLLRSTRKRACALVDGATHAFDCAWDGTYHDAHALDSAGNTIRVTSDSKAAEMLCKDVAGFFRAELGK